MVRVVGFFAAASAATMLMVSGCGSESEKQDAHAGHEHAAHAKEGATHAEHAAHAGDGAAAAEQLEPQKTCPVMGGEINKELFVEQDGKRIYVCCEGCIEQVKNNFSQQVEKLAEMGQKPEKI